jgi:hypothetical protein
LQPQERKTWRERERERERESKANRPISFAGSDWFFTFGLALQRKAIRFAKLIGRLALQDPVSFIGFISFAGGLQISEIFLQS